MHVEWSNYEGIGEHNFACMQKSGRRHTDIVPL